MMKHLKSISRLAVCLAIAGWSVWPLAARHGDDWQNVTCLSGSDKTAVFRSEGEGDNRDQMSHDAKCRLFYALFYKGVMGVNDGQPLVTREDVRVTDPFFNGGQKYEAYVFNCDGQEAAKKSKGKYRGACTISVSMKLLSEYLEQAGVKEAAGVPFGTPGQPLMPSITVVPYRKAGESYVAKLQSDYDLRRAVSNVQDGFRSLNVTTFDFEARARSVDRRTAYEDNAGVATSNDAELLKSTGADVYVEVDLNKFQTAQGNRVSLVMKAYETATGNVLASKDGSTRFYPNASTDDLTKYAVRDHLQAFLDDICSHWNGSGRGTNGSTSTRVFLSFSIAGSSLTSFDDPVGPRNMKLSFLINQWVKRNSYQAQYHPQGVVAEKLLYDNVTIPPTDSDGFPMDPMTFAYLIETYLKDELDLTASSRIDGNNILITIQ